MTEFELIEAIEARLGLRGERVIRGLGDDAAVVRARGVAVTSVDVVADGVHFERATHSAGDVGHKALATALSDLAAMGATSGEAFVSLALPSTVGTNWALELVDGLEELAERTGTTVAGGDVVSAGSLMVAVTVAGWAASERDLVYRDGARPGHLVGVSGELGGSGAGLMLVGGLAVPSLEAEEADRLMRRHRRPEPRLELGRGLAYAGVSAMIDLSDGVATDAAHVGRRSGARLDVRLDGLPLAAGVADVAAAAARDAAELAASAGEDYELLFTAPPERREAVERAGAAAGTSVSWLGEVVAGPPGVRLLDAAGGLRAIRGHEHGRELDHG